MAKGVTAQTETAVNTIEKALQDAQSGLCDIVRLRVIVPDPSQIKAVSAVLRDRIGFTRPANTTICSPLAVPDAHVEIEADAIRDSGTPA